jgi:hypothetical protein
VYHADATELAAWPGATAMAQKLSEALKVIGPEYTVDRLVGVAPLVV